MTEKNKILLFCGGWIVLNCIQAIFLDITPDEAYYFMYSEHLYWGYFDHPPMVAVLIKLGYSIFSNELGVRLLFTVMSGVALYLIFFLAKIKRATLYIMLTLSVFAVHLFGFHALPDVPLIFFTVTFLWLLKRYLQQDSWLISLLMAINIGLLLLSKYHGILLIIITIIALPKLMKRPSFWAIATGAFLLMFPHAYWQYTHDFQTLNFHLAERNWKALPYNPLNTLTYMAMQPIMAGPFIGFLLFWGAFKYQGQNDFDKVLKALFWGIYGFFFVMTFKGGDVHPHWTSIALVPLIILSSRYIEAHIDKLQKAVKWLFMSSIIIFLLGRIILVYDFLPFEHERIHGYEKWTKEIQAKSNDNPVVFINSYEQAARYHFYSKQPAISMGNIFARRTQYDFLQPDTSIFGKKVCVIPNWKNAAYDSFNTNIGKQYHYFFVDSFVYYPQIKIIPEEKSFKVGNEKQAQIPIRIINEHFNDAELQFNAKHPPRISYHIFKEGKMVLDRRTQEKVIDYQNTNEPVNFTIDLPPEKGNYVLKFGVWCGQIPPWHNSTIIKLKVE